MLLFSSFRYETKSSSRTDNLRILRFCDFAFLRFCDFEQKNLKQFSILFIKKNFSMCLLFFLLLRRIFTVDFIPAKTHLRNRSCECTLKNKITFFFNIYANDYFLIFTKKTFWLGYSILFLAFSELFKTSFFKWKFMKKIRHWNNNWLF